MKVDLYSETGTKLTTKVELPKEIFGIKPNKAALRQYIHVYQTNQRQGTSKAKTRGEVRGGGKKPWRQKGTGRARHGSIRSPIWVGGGVVHGPRPREFSLSIPKKMARLALKSALSLKAGEGKVTVLQGLGFKEPKTAKAADLLKKLKAGKRVLLLIPEKDDNLYLSFRNIPGVEVREARNMNAYDVVLAGDILLLEEAISNLNERLVDKPKKKAVPKKTEQVGKSSAAKKKTEAKTKTKKARVKKASKKTTRKESKGRGAKR